MSEEEVIGITQTSSEEPAPEKPAPEEQIAEIDPGVYGVDAAFVQQVRTALAIIADQDAQAEEAARKAKLNSL